MGLLDVLSLLGGIALFLFGMFVMSNGLEKMAGSKLERILESLTRNIFMSMLLGLAVTAVIQSSSATTVMVIGFVNARMMKLKQATGVIMGANIGTTVTSWILSLGDISSNMLILQLLKPKSLAPLLLLIGIILYMTSKRGFKHDLSTALLGFGVLFVGMTSMESAVSVLKESESLRNLLFMFNNPFFGIAAGALVTAIIQSSSASIGILQAISSTGALPFSAAIPIIAGQNIGTCVTAMLSSIGASRNAKRTALIHLYFNVIGVVVFLSLVYAANALVHLPFWNNDTTRLSIAIFHMSFNIFTTAMLLPFSNSLVKLSELTIPGSKGERDESDILDIRFLSTPAIALGCARDAVVEMSELALENYRQASVLIYDYDQKKRDLIDEREALIDRLEVRINQYLLRMDSRELSNTETRMINELLRSVGDMERIGDYTINIAEKAGDLSDYTLSFSEKAKRELTLILNAVSEIIEITDICYKQKDAQLANRVEPLEQTIDLLTQLLRDRHIARLQSEICSAETGAVYLELLINLERIADHCSNLALTIIQCYGMHQDATVFDAHEYVRRLHSGENESFRCIYGEYNEKYILLLENI